MRLINVGRFEVRPVSVLVFKARIICMRVHRRSVPGRVVVPALYVRSVDRRHVGSVWLLITVAVLSVVCSSLGLHILLDSLS